MAEKRIKKHRSNWYIYLITFVTTLIILFLVILSLSDILFPEPSQSNLSASGIADYRPNVSFNTSFILMLSQDKGGVPDFYMLANYRPRDDALVLVPVDKMMYYSEGSLSGNLSEIYSSRGCSGIEQAIQNTFDTKIDFYIKFDKTSLIDFINLVGTVTVNIPYDLESQGEPVFKAGTHLLNGSEVYDYITFSEIEGGEERRAIMLATVFTSFINDNCRNRTAAELQGYARKLINTTDTNYKFEDFTKNQPAYMYTTQYSYNIAENYVPLYNYDDNGYYIISPTSIITIKDRFKAS